MEKFREKIEEHANTMEELGLSPVPARIYVYLLCCDPPGATFEEMVSYFSVSKSAVSNALKMLQTAGVADSRTYGGKRRRYFFLDFDKTFSESFMTSRYRKMKGILDDIKLLRNKDDQFGMGLEHAALLYKMLLVEMPIILERWKRTIEMSKEMSNE